MKEEFHGDGDGIGYKRLYNWNSLTASVWLPSLIELVGIDPNKYHATWGTYLSAMQGLNISTTPDTDKQGGNQWNYFAQYNASSGGERLWALGRNEQFWTRSSVYANQLQAWRITSTQRFDWTGATASHAVHPAVLLDCMIYLLTGQGESPFLPIKYKKEAPKGASCFVSC